MRVSRKIFDNMPFHLFEIVLLVFFIFTSYLFVTVTRQARVLKDVPGPPSPNFLLGHVLQRRRSPAGTVHQDWMKRYGHVYKTYGLMFVSIFVAMREYTQYLTSYSAPNPPPDGSESG